MPRFETPEDFRFSVLGRTGLAVGRLGLAGSYGAPARAYEMAFDQGCNYFYFGGGRKRGQMKQAIRNLAGRGLRDKMVVSIQTYARFGLLTPMILRASLRSMGLDHADILVLGWHNKRPPARLLDLAQRMKADGLIRYVGMSGHNRAIMAQMAREGMLDLFHIRYNPAHQGAATQCFPAFDQPRPPGLVTYTATRWGHLISAKHMPKGEAPLTAADCYRFALSHPRVNVCLCGPANEAQMAHALTALEKGPLTPEEKKRIKRIGRHVHDHVKSSFT